MEETQNPIRYTGSCHCGAVQFEVDLDLTNGVSRCNCSICTRTAVSSAMARPDAFRVTRGEAAIGTYEWGAKLSTRYFCQQCGIHCFGRGHLAELGGDYVAVNVNCLETVDVGVLPVQF